MRNSKNALKNTCIGVTSELEAEHTYGIYHIYQFLNLVTDAEWQCYYVGSMFTLP
jgi:hypothetical protein